MSNTFPVALRALADWYEAHPDIPSPSDPLQVFRLQTKEEAARVVLALGSCRKRYADGSDGLLYIERDFGGVVLSFVFSREEVCVRKVVGTRSVPERITPAHEVEIVEWECEPVLAAVSE